jgi:hypothetical protein
MKSASPRTCQMKSAPPDRGDCTTALRPQHQPQTWGEQFLGRAGGHVARLCWPRGGQSSDAVDPGRLPSSLCSPYVRTSQEWLSLVADFTNRLCGWRALTLVPEVDVCVADLACAGVADCWRYPHSPVTVPRGPLRQPAPHRRCAGRPHRGHRRRHGCPKYVHGARSWIGSGPVIEDVNPR